MLEPKCDENCHFAFLAMAMMAVPLFLPPSSSPLAGKELSPSCFFGILSPSVLYRSPPTAHIKLLLSPISKKNEVEEKKQQEHGEERVQRQSGRRR